MTPSRRRFLAVATSATAAALAGCTTFTGGDSPAESPTDSPTAPSAPGERPTVTPRDPTPLDVSGTWPQQGFDPGHTANASAPGVPGDGEAYWHLRRLRSGPCVLADGLLFHYALLGEDPEGPPTATSTPPTPGVGSYPEREGTPALVARDATDGRVRWYRDLGGPAGGWPAVAGDRVVVAVDNRLAAYEREGGRTVWTHDLGDDVPGNPTVVDDRVVVPVQGAVGRNGKTLREPRVRAHDLADGSERWTVPAPERQNGLAVGSGTVFVVSGGYDGAGVALALSLAGGRERWRVEVPGDAFGGPVVGDAVYLSSDEGQVLRLDPADGTERWRRTLDDGPAGLAHDGETLYAGTPRGLHALRASDGTDRWTVGADADEEVSFEAPAVGDGVLYVGTRGADEARFLALDAAGGSERWGASLPRTIVEGDMVMAGATGQATVADGAVYLPAVDGLYAFGPAE